MDIVGDGNLLRHQNRIPVVKHSVCMQQSQDGAEDSPSCLGR